MTDRRLRAAFSVQALSPTEQPGPINAQGSPRREEAASDPSRDYAPRLNIQGLAIRLHSASISFMTTLYIRDVSDEVADTLKDRAAAEGKSLSAYVAGELSKMAARPTNVEIVAKLRSRDRSSGPTTDEIVAEVRAGRR